LVSVTVSRERLRNAEPRFYTACSDSDQSPHRPKMTRPSKPLRRCSAVRDRGPSFGGNDPEGQIAVTQFPPLRRQGLRDFTNDDARRDANDGNIGVRHTDSRRMRVQSKSRCWCPRNPGGNRNDMPHRRRVARTPGRTRRWGHTHLGWKPIVRLGPVRVRQFLTPPAHL